MRRVLITGCTGFVGDTYTRDMVGNDKGIYRFYSDRETEYLLPGRMEMDLLNMHSVRNYFSQHKPNIVVHLAAKCGGLFDNIQYPANFWYENTLMSTIILQESLLSGVKHFVGCLSSCVYPDKVGEGYYPMQTKDIFRGSVSEANLGYGFGKRALLEGMMSYQKQYPHMTFHGLIPCNLFGVGDKSTHFIPSFIKRLKAGEKDIELNGTGNELRQFMDVDDFCCIIFDYLKKIDEIPGEGLRLFNVAPDRPQTSIKELANLIASKFGATVKFNYMKNSQFRKDIDGSEILKIIPHKFNTIEETISCLL